MIAPRPRSLDLSGLASVALLSVLVNLLMLTSPLFMLQVYDRVLSSRSEETLAALMLLVTVLYGAMAVLDHVRGRIGARIGARLQAAVDVPHFARLLGMADPGQTGPALAEVESVRRLFGAPVIFALFDLPFTPLLLGAIFLFHPLLGCVALGGGAVLILLALLNRWLTAGPAARQRGASGQAGQLAATLDAGRDTLRALGMTDAMLNRWSTARRQALTEGMRLSDRNGGLTSASRSFRLFLQSALLGAGAWLVLQEAISPGVMFASSIMFGRALAPVEQLIAGWEQLAQGRAAWTALRSRLSVPAAPAPMPLGRPEPHLAVRGLAVTPPGASRFAASGVDFELRGGQALAILGESGSGKSSLLRALSGVWTPRHGDIRLGGAALDRFAPADRAALIGVLPQSVDLFPGTVAENIARFGDAEAEAIVAAARTAGALETILALPEGFDTQLGPSGMGLSGGQAQRVALARAFFGDPMLLVLDEPHASQDAAGCAAIGAAIRRVKEGGGMAIVTAHRREALADCDLVLVLRAGRAVAFGPRDDVMAERPKPALEAA